MIQFFTWLPLLLLPSTPLQDGGDLAWPQFRGPGGLCIADDAPIPASFGPDENVLWKTEVPPGHSSPCIVGDRIFLTGFEGEDNILFAVDRTSGEMLWSRTYRGAAHPGYLHPDAVPALPTPASDGEHVVAYFGNYGLVAVNIDGEDIWEKRMEHPGYGFGVGTSPVLFEGLLILSRDGAAEAAIMALDVTDGSELWSIDRFDYGESHGSPFVWRNADRDELIVGGTGRLCSFHPGTGELLWQVDGVTAFPCTTPTADDDTVYFAAWSTSNASGRDFWEGGFGRSLDLTDAEVENPQLLFKRLDANGDGVVEPDEVPECRAKDAFGFIDANQNGTWEAEEMVAPPTAAQVPGRNLMVAVASGAEGNATETHVKWTHSRGLPYVSSPLSYRGRVWLFKSGGLATCLDAKSGEPVFGRERLPDRSEYYMSPVGAAGKVVVGTAEGTLYVLDAEADGLVILHTVQFDDELFATPAIIDGTIYLRSKSTLWAFGEKR